MNNKFLIIVFLAVSLLTGCSEEETTPAEEGLIKTVNVETTTVQPQTFERFLRLVGTIESENDVQISSEVSGRITRFYVDKGDQVEKGAPILKIEDSKLLQERSRLQAQTEQAREQYQRLKRVYEQDGIGSEIDVINAKTTYKERKSALESLNVDLRNTTVRAPFEAILDEKVLEVGEMASPGNLLVRLIGSDNLKIVAGVPSRFADAVSKGDTVQVWFDFSEADTLTLPISYIGQSIDKEARTFRIEIDLSGQSKKYKVDMIANVKLRISNQDKAVVIGEEYIYQKKDEIVVYTVAQNDSNKTIAREHVITTGASYENNIVVEKGLHMGDELITVGSSFLQDSMRIKVVKNREKEITQQNR